MELANQKLQPQIQGVTLTLNHVEPFVISFLKQNDFMDNFFW
jgi:hypothetical protein